MTGVAAFETDFTFLGEVAHSVKFFSDSGLKMEVGVCCLWCKAGVGLVVWWRRVTGWDRIDSRTTSVKVRGLGCTVDLRIGLRGGILYVGRCGTIS